MDKLCWYLLISISIFGIIGWLFYPPIVRFPVDWSDMKLNTCIAFLLWGLAVRGKHKILIYGVAVFLIILPTIVLIQYLMNTQINLLDDPLHLDQASRHTSHPGRPSPLTAINFIIMGAHLFIGRFKHAHIYFMATISFSVVIGTLIFVLRRISQLDRFAFTDMAVPTAICFILTIMVLEIQYFKHRNDTPNTSWRIGWISKITNIRQGS